MFEAPNAHVPAILAELGPSLFVVSPFIPACVLALTLICLSAIGGPARSRRQVIARARPELIAAGALIAVALTLGATVRGHIA